MSEEMIFNESYDQLTPDTPAHAEKFNKIFDLLLENDKFLKYAADALAEKMLEKSMVANNLVTDNEGMVLAAPMGKLLKEQLDEQNNNIGYKYLGLVSYETINNPKYNESYIGYIAAETAEKIGLPSAVYKVRYTQYARPAEAHGSLEVCVVNGTLHGQWFHNHASSGSWVGWDRFISNSDFCNKVVVNNSVIVGSYITIGSIVFARLQKSNIQLVQNTEYDITSGFPIPDGDNFNTLEFKSNLRTYQISVRNETIKLKCTSETTVNGAYFPFSFIYFKK